MRRMPRAMAGAARRRRSGHACSTRSPTGWRRISSCWPLPRRSTTASRSARPRGADVPLAIDHFRYFAGCIRAEEGATGRIDNDTIAYHFKEPLGVVGQIIPWNFPLLMAAWKLAPALGRRQLHGHQAGIQHAAEPAGADGPHRRYSAAGRAQRVHRAGSEVGQAAGASPRIAKVCLHRRDDDRAADHAVRGRAPDPADDGTRRQVAEHLHGRRDGRRRRLLRQGAGRLRAVRLQQGRGLHLPFARAGAGIDLRQVHGESGGARREDQGRRSARSRDADGRAGFAGSVGEDPRLYRDRQAGRRQMRDRRRTRASRRRTGEGLLS